MGGKMKAVQVSAAVDGPPFARVEGSEEELSRKWPDARRSGAVELRDFGFGSETGVVAVFEDGTFDTAKWRDESKACPDAVLRQLVHGSVDFLTPSISVHPIRSATLPPFKHTNLVVVRRPDAIVLVDPGGNDDDALRQVLTSLPADRQVHVLVTHRHRDHWNALPVVERVFPGALLCGSAECLGQVSGCSLKQRVFPMDRESVLCGLRLVPTPGHTDGDLSLFDPVSRVLCVGDHCVGAGSSVLDAECGDLNRYLDSCKKLLALQAAMVVPAHGPLHTEPQQLLEGYMQHRLAREAQIIECLDKGLRTPEEIVAVVYATTPKHLWPAAMSNIGLHLRKIREDRSANL